MSILKNEVLAEIDDNTRPSATHSKLKQIMLLSVLDGYMSGKLTTAELENDLKMTLTK